MWTRLVAAGLCLLVIVYWLAVGLSGWDQESGRFRLLLTVLLVLILAAVIRTVSIGRADAAVSVGAIALGVLAGLGPVLLNEWIRGGDRYVWIINQNYPCSTMGGGPGFIWVTGTSVLFALGAFAFGWSNSDTSSRQRGIAAGLGLVGLTAVAMFPRPEIFATLLGCI